MNSYIKKLQSKSEKSRKQILMITVISCMAVILLGWAYSLGDHLGSTSVSATQEEGSDLKPFKIFANSISNMYKDSKASAGDAQPVNTQAPKQIDLIPVEHPNQ